MIGALNKLFRKTASLKGKDIFDKVYLQFYSFINALLEID